MKIACISASMVPGRTANALQTMKVTEAISELGHELTLWLPDFGQEFSWEEASAVYGISKIFEVRRPSIWMPLGRYDFSIKSVLQARRWGADLIYTWPLQAAALASRMGIPTLLEAHDEPQGRLGPWLFRQFLNGAGACRLLVTTQTLQAYLAEKFGSGRVDQLARHAPNGVDLDRYHDLPSPEEARRMLGLPERFTAVYTGHLYPGRGLELMLKLAEENPEVNFVWAGGTKKAIADWTARVELAGVANIKLLGFIPNERLPQIQAAGEVLLMPYERRISVSGGGDSARFASPMKAFEYMAAGRAIMSSDLPVFREVLNENVARLLPPEDWRAWDEALAELREDAAARTMMAGAARRRAENYSWRSRAERSLKGLVEADAYA